MRLSSLRGFHTGSVKTGRDADVRVESYLAPIADVGRAPRHVAEVPEADQATCTIRGARHADVFQLGRPRKILPIRTSVRIP
jgi:hypothetical protein